jgi:hypothetical protein
MYPAQSTLTPCSRAPRKLRFYDASRYCRGSLRPSLTLAPRSVPRILGRGQETFLLPNKATSQSAFVTDD